MSEIAEKEIAFSGIEYLANKSSLFAVMKSIIITGAGSGIGRAAALRLGAEADTALILVGRRESALKETLDFLPNKENHSLLASDVSEPGAFEKALKSVESRHHDIFGVFANAGIGGENHYGPEDRWSEVIKVNLDGTYYTIMAALPYLRKSRAPMKNILITSSCLARFGVPRYTAYCTAKTGLMGLTRSLAIELAPERFTVNALCPGWVETDMARAGIQKLADKAETSYDREFARQMSFVPLGKMSQPEEIAEMAAFLLLNKQTSVTGQAIDINNGSFMI
jgi:NAD(P)-dependent dehydrogenase (short-subunit alcohol dehydrogenase family)